MKTMKITIVLLLTFLLSNSIFSQNVIIENGKVIGNDSENNALADNICGASYSAWQTGTPVDSFESTILNEINVSYDDPLRAKKISDFINNNHDKLICSDDSLQKHRKREHVFKRAIALQSYYYFHHLAKSDDYSINMNFYEIVDGKKETLLDYVDMILNDPEKREMYNLNSLNNLRDTLEDLGVVKGSELD
jgi:hypothetical protein